MKLRDWLAEHRKTHEEFAEASGIERTSVTRYANGTRRPRANAIRAIKRATGGAVTAEDFLDEPGDLDDADTPALTSEVAA